MGTKVTLTVPDHVYQQAEQIARAEQRPVAEVINDALARLFPVVHVSQKREQMEQEQNAFRRQHNQLLNDYQGEYVAMYQGKVIDHDGDRLKLVARIDEKYANDVVLIKQVSDKPDDLLHMRSPRLIPE